MIPPGLDEASTGDRWRRAARTAGTAPAGRSGRAGLAAVTVVTALVVLLAVGCSSSTDDASGPQPGSATTLARRLAVVASIPILGDVVRSVLGDRGDVTVVTRPGQDPRTATVGAGDQAAWDAADVIVTVDPTYEVALQPALAEARARGATVVEVLPSLSPITADDGQPDPHVWLDPDRVSTMADQIAQVLRQRVGDQDEAAWQADADGVAAEMATADEGAQAALNPLPDDRRVVVTSSDGLAYLAQRYGLTVRAPRAGEPALDVAVDTLGSAPPEPTTVAELITRTAGRLAAWLRTSASANP